MLIFIVWPLSDVHECHSLQFLRDYEYQGWNLGPAPRHISWARKASLSPPNHLWGQDLRNQERGIWPEVELLKLLPGEGAEGIMTAREQSAWVRGI